MAIQITNGQLKKLESYALDNYLNELAQHCNENFPHLKHTMGNECLKQVLKELVNYSMQKGLTQKDTIRFYIDMCINFGIGFEKDPQYFWSEEIYLKYKEFGELTQAEMIYFEAIRNMEMYYGQNEQLKYVYINNLIDYLSNKGIVQNRTNQFDDIDVLLGIENINEKDITHKYIDIRNNTQELINEISFQLSEIAPTKYLSTPKEKINILIELGIVKAKEKYNFYSQHKITCIVLLMFILGRNFDSDPFIISGLKNIKDIENQTNTDATFDQYIFLLKQFKIFNQLGDNEYAS